MKHKTIYAAHAVTDVEVEKMGIDVVVDEVKAQLALALAEYLVDNYDIMGIEKIRSFENSKSTTYRASVTFVSERDFKKLENGLRDFAGFVTLPNKTFVRLYDLL